MNRKKIIRELQLIDEKRKRKARKTLANFISYTKHDYEFEWFHILICSYLDKLYSGEIKKLMIFVPPQHGKSEISSRRFPAYVLGKQPDKKIGVCSYSPDLAGQFNRSVQDIMDDVPYAKIFPDTMLLSSRVPIELRGNTVRNNTVIETVKHKGFLKTVGIGSALTGTPLDIGIIDDPFKDRKTANSELIRDDVWNWYNDVFKTRLHNDSQQLLLFTRWHEDDLAGRLLDPSNAKYDAEEASQWTVIALPALKEPIPNPFNTVDLTEDRREIDEALWESRHSSSKYFMRRRTSPTSFASLDQQRPSLIEGNKIKKEWFEIIKESELPYNPHTQQTVFFVDGAFTDKTQNDETGLLACCYFRGKLYIYNCLGVRKELYELLTYIRGYTGTNYHSAGSILHIELKASGYPLKSMLESPEYGNYNCMGIPSFTVALGKFNRVENIEPFLSTGKVVLVQGSWNLPFLAQCGSFPNGTHDDMVDVLAYAVHHYFLTGDQDLETAIEEVAKLDTF